MFPPLVEGWLFLCLRHELLKKIHKFNSTTEYIEKFALILFCAILGK